MTTSFDLKMPPLALVSIGEPQMRDFVIAELQGMGFEVHRFSPEYDIALQLHSHSYRVVVAGTSDPASQGLQVELASLPVDRRRELFVVLVGEGVESRSSMAAFVQSVDLMLSPDDLTWFRSLVERGIAAQDQFYEALRSVQRIVRAG